MPRLTVQVCRLLLALVLGLILAPSQALAQDKEITVLMHSVHLGALGGEEGLIREFEEQTGISLDIVTGGTNQIYEQALTAWVGGAQTFDAMIWLPRWLTEDVVDFFEPVDPYLENASGEYEVEDLIPSLLDGGRFPRGDGTAYLIPFRVGVAMLYYNQDLFAQAGLEAPTNWQEFREAALALSQDTDGDGTTDVYGWGQRGITREVAEDFYRVGFGFGGEMLSADLSQCTMNSQPWVDALTLWVDMFEQGALPPDLLAWGRDDYILGMQQGDVAMSIMYGPYWGLLTNPEDSEIADGVGWTVVPSAPGVEEGRTQYSAWSWGISGDSDQKDAAWQFIQFATNKENQLIAALEYDNGPTRASVYQDQQYQERFPVAAGWLEALRSSSQVVAHADLPRMDDIISEELHNALQGNKSPQEALDGACRRIQPLL
ncbi:MAG: sugar ABC transporter substrate-binding protein [Trueperaceae bacterium]